tara:strand:- start:5582 stop:6160 length:579 start_codon:yes stop_codon:yes gene_type:complete
MAKPLTPPAAPPAAATAATPLPTTDEPPDISTVMAGLKQTARSEDDARTKAIESLAPDMQEYFGGLDQPKKDELLSGYIEGARLEAAEDPWGVATQARGVTPRMSFSEYVDQSRAKAAAIKAEAAEEAEDEKLRQELHEKARGRAWVRWSAAQQGIEEGDILDWLIKTGGSVGDMPEGWTPPPGFEPRESDY